MELPGPESDYHSEAIARFQTLCQGRKLIANVDHKEGGLLHLRLMDPTDLGSVRDPCACINADLVGEGFAAPDRKQCKYFSSYPQMKQKLDEVLALAKRERLGMFEFGDIEEDE